MVGVVFSGVAAMVAVVTSPQLLDVVCCSAVVVVVVVVGVAVVAVLSCSCSCSCSCGVISVVYCSAL